MVKEGWIGVDLDGTLAHYDEWVGETIIGAPIPKMVERVKRWLAAGYNVRIFTARANQSSNSHIVNAINRWCLTHIGQVLPVTYSKDFEMLELWDDRAVQVIPNTGEIYGISTRGLT